MTLFHPFRRTSRALAAAVMLAAGIGSASAQASDIESLRARASKLGERVSDLERKRAGLAEQEAILRNDLARSTAHLGTLELEKYELERTYAAAREIFIARAIEAYKTGPTADVELLLGAKTVTQFLTLMEAKSRAASQDSSALDALESAAASATDKQEAIELSQRDIIRSYASIEAVVDETQDTLETRRELMNEVVSQIEEIEEQARLAAAGSGDPSKALLELLAPAGPAPGIPDGFAPTGVSFEGVASWYGPGFEGDHTASGDVFDSDLYTAASKDLPLGTWLFVKHGSLGVVVLINDRGPYVNKRVLDLSRAAAEAVGISGLGWIEAEILIQT